MGNILDQIDYILKNMNVNEFSSQNIINEDAGEYRVNCSGLIKYLLKKNGRDLNGEKAFQIYDELLPHSFNNIQKLEPGDLILWKKNVVPNKGSTGHAAVFLSLVKKEEDGIIIRVFDASKIPHENDSRSEAGIGVGEMKILTDDSEAKGFVWSKVEKKTKFTQIIFVKP